MSFTYRNGSCDSNSMGLGTPLLPKIDRYWFLMFFVVLYFVFLPFLLSSFLISFFLSFFVFSFIPYLLIYLLTYLILTYFPSSFLPSFLPSYLPFSRLFFFIFSYSVINHFKNFKSRIIMSNGTVRAVFFLYLLMLHCLVFLVCLLVIEIITWWFTETCFRFCTKWPTPSRASGTPRPIVWKSTANTCRWCMAAPMIATPNLAFFGGGFPVIYHWPGCFTQNYANSVVDLINMHHFSALFYSNR